MTPPRPECFDCIYFNSKDTERLSCRAYPNGIDKNIIEGEPHNIIRKNQKGNYVFKEKEGD